jgi:hypothetical protein
VYKAWKLPLWVEAQPPGVSGRTAALVDLRSVGIDGLRFCSAARAGARKARSWVGLMSIGGLSLSISVSLAVSSRCAVGTLIRRYCWSVGWPLTRATERPRSASLGSR